MTAATARRTAPSNVTFGAKRDTHDVARLRPAELRRLFRRRHGRTYPFDDVGLRARDVVLDHIVQSGAVDASQQATTFLAECCPWTVADERPAVIRQAIQRRKFWDKSELGNLLGLTWEERDACRITTIRPAGATDADMADRRRLKGKLAKQEKRRMETLHPNEDLPKPAIRAHAIAAILRIGERCAVSAICEELKRTRQIPFAHLEGKALTTAVHKAIDYGIEHGFFLKVVDRAGRIPVATITKIVNAR
ncbi:hypothetical protein [Bradyrhizobium sp. RT6a]|uniref:hypothetical protein n=1 Tax=unclassified Bradyrhizobium TaxID=2631580 RepID=UPI0033941BC2